MLSVSVIVVTFNRPSYVRHCLECLLAQTPCPFQIIVVDASPNAETRDVVSDFPEVLYLHNKKGIGHMISSRNMGLQRAAGDIVAYVDDDAYAHPGWLVALVEAYSNPSIGAVGGRALNHIPGEATRGLNEIGQLKPDGQLTGNFAANPGKIIEVDHIIGCNMSFRRDILQLLGNLREEYPGTEIRDETDICLRVKKLGYRILFTPAACIDHVAAPRSDGERFDTRYFYYAQRNHYVLLIRNFGLNAPILRRFFVFSTITTVRSFVRRIGGAVLNTGAIMLGTVTGIAAGIILLSKSSPGPRDRDQGSRDTNDPRPHGVGAVSGDSL